MEGGKAVSVTKRTGDRGEAEVAKYLRKKGYTLLASQWRCRFGELDLVAKSKRGVICFVEVKLRSEGAIGLPREFVDGKKKERLRRAALAYLSQHELDAPARFDVAEVYQQQDQALRIEYLEGAFE
jgi:putative endonuclease